MTHEAGIWIFGIITLVCLSVWLLCRRSKAVEDAVESAPFHYEPNLSADRQDSDLVTQLRAHMADMHREKPKPLPKGWQGWEGGECPIPNETMVVVMFRDGTIEAAFPANMFGWKHFDWCGDIVAWRVA